MKATGIVRRIDDLGRVVVPKEIRRTLRIREGDPMEIFTDREGEIILKKYSPIGELGTFSQQYADAVFQATKHPILVCDRDQFIAAAGLPKKEFIGASIHTDLERTIANRQNSLIKKSDRTFINLTCNAAQVLPDFHTQAIATILSAGDTVGAIIIFSPAEHTPGDSAPLQLALSGANFLGRQLEN